MQVIQWRREGHSNYGDELNSFLWPKLLHPRAEHSFPGAYLYGIGTLLCRPDKTPEASQQIVFGAGAGYWGTPVPNDKWKIYFVRGPLTAELMGGCPHITDPGILMKLFYKKAERPIYEVSFMPRWDHISDELREGCRQAEIHLINPQRSVDVVTHEIAATRLLLSEALHGAVVADALRVPWIHIKAEEGHEFKWRDWTGSHGMVWNYIDAQERGLTWARKYAVPQLSAESVHKDRLSKVRGQIEKLNNDIEEDLRARSV